MNKSNPQVLVALGVLLGALLSWVWSEIATSAPKTDVFVPVLAECVADTEQYLHTGLLGRPVAGRYIRFDYTPGSHRRLSGVLQLSSDTFEEKQLLAHASTAMEHCAPTEAQTLPVSPGSQVSAEVLVLLEQAVQAADSMTPTYIEVTRSELQFWSAADDK